MKGYVYFTNNKINLRKRIGILKQRRIPYTIYDEYFVCGRKMEEEEFNKKYYCRFLGTTEIKRFKNNEVEEIIEKKNKLSAYNCEFFKGTKRYILKAFGKVYFFRRLKEYDNIFDKFFTKKVKDFCEFNFFEVYAEDKDSLLDKYSFDVFDVPQYFNNTEEITKLNELEEYDNNKEFKDFDIKYYFDKMTNNQAKILALFLIGLSNKAISILMNSSSTYIFLEKERIIKKIKKLMKKREKNGV